MSMNKMLNDNLTSKKFRYRLKSIIIMINF